MALHRQRPLLPLAIAAMAMLLGPARPASAQIPDARWELIQNGPQPDRAHHVMVFDPFSDSLWAFGGVEADPDSNNYDNSVWRFALSDPDARWARQSISGLQPPPVIFHTAVFDPERRRMIVYGGQLENAPMGSDRLMDGSSVWFLELSDPDDPSWTRESVAGILGDRFAHAAVYVPGLDAMVVSGGVDALGGFRSANYALMLGETPVRWERLSDVGFQPRAAQALIFDGERERLLSYGGFIDDDSTTRNIDVLDLSAGLDGAERWTRLSTANAGLSRGFVAHFVDVERGLWWIHGGRLSGNAFSNRLSALDLSQAEARWSETSLVANGPLQRFGHAAAWDPERATAWFQGGTPDNNRTFADLRALVFERPPTATSSPTTAATPSLTATSTATPTVTATTDASPTPPDETATPSATPPDATPTPPESTATATEPAETPSPTRTLEATATATATRVDLPPLPIYLPLVQRGFVIRPTLEPTATDAATPTATLEATPTATLELTPTTSPTIAPSPTPTKGPEMQVLGHYGGEARTLELGDDPSGTAGARDRIYLGVGPRVEILDRENLAPVGRSEVLPGIVQSLLAEGERLYVGHREGLSVLDVTRPDDIEVLSSQSIFEVGDVQDMQRIGDLLVAASGTSLQLFDLSDPDRPASLSQTSVGRTALAVAAEGDRAYIGHTEGLVAFDISNPTAPAELGRLELGDDAEDLLIDGDRMWIAGERGGLLSADVSDPAALSLSATLEVNGWPRGIARSGERLYLAADFGGLAIVDIQDPDSPQLRSNLPTTAGDAFDLRLLDDRAYLADAGGGLQVADVSDPAAPAAVDEHPVPGRMTHLSIAGDVAWTVQNNKDVRAIDISDPNAPTLLATIAETEAEATLVDGNRLYLAQGFRGIAIYDVSDPAAPSLLSELSTEDNVYDLALEGRVLHAANLGKLVSIDVSDPRQPQILGSLETPGSTTRILADDDIVYLRADQDLWIVDAGDPSAPSLLTELDLAAGVDSMRLDGDRLWLTDSAADLVVYDVADPAAPELLASYGTRSGAYGLALGEARAYLGSFVGLEIFDIQDPAAASSLARFRLGGRFFGLDFAGQTLLMAGDGGLYSLRFDLP